MLFVTVGTQLPFDRLVRTVDDWAADAGRCDVFAQIGPGAWRPRHVEWVEFMSPADFESRASTADMLVSHAGMGSILTALEMARPIIVLPRRASLGEHRNDHQLATARWLRALGKIIVAFDEGELRARLDNLAEISAATRIGHDASAELLTTLHGFIQRGALAVGARRGPPSFGRQGSSG